MQVLSSAPKGQEFVLHDGTLLKSVEGLYRAVLGMKDEEFSRFVSSEKNDFAVWIEHCLDDKFLAAAVRRATTRERVLKVLFMHLFR